MKKAILLSLTGLLSILLLLSCTKEVERIIYENKIVPGKVVGLITQKESQARIYLRQALITDSATVDAATGAFEFTDVSIGDYDLLIIAPGFGTQKITGVHVESGGTAYVGEVTLPRLPDLIHSHYPDDEAELATSNNGAISIIINFSEPMNRESVEAAFSTEPASEGTFYWSQSLWQPSTYWYWDDTENSKNWGDTGTGQSADITTYTNIRSVQYVMRSAYVTTNSHYQVQISTAAHDSAGNALNFPLQYDFYTIESGHTQTAILSDPEDGAENINPMSYTSVFITFPKRMDQTSVESALSMSPQSDALYLWPSANQLKIYFGGPLMADTTYSFSVAKTALDLDGAALGKDFNFSFTTAPVQVQSTSPGNGQVFVELQPKIYVHFNTYMVQSSVQNAWSITPAVSGDFVWKAGNYFYFEPRTELQEYTKYTIRFETSATDQWGRHLKEPYEFTFATMKK